MRFTAFTKKNNIYIIKANKHKTFASTSGLSCWKIANAQLKSNFN